MGFVSKDPNRAPDITPELLDAAVKKNLVIVAVCCDQARPTTEGGIVSFVALSAAVPRIGERITLEDGVGAVVKIVDYVCVRENGIPHLVPNVLAVFTDVDSEQI